MNMNSLYSMINALDGACRGAAGRCEGACNCEYVVGDGLEMTLSVLAMARLCCSET